MQKTSTYRPWLAIFLVMLIVQVTLMKDLHHLLPHQHEEHPTCDSASAHLHTADYVHADCLICFFHFAPADLEENGMSVFTPVVDEVKIDFAFQNVEYGQTLIHYFLRGPPISITS